MTDYTTNFATPSRQRRDTSPLEKDAITMVALLARVPFLVRKAGPMSPARRRFYVAAPLLGIGLGAAATAAREGSLTREDIEDTLPIVVAMSAIGVAGAATEVAVYSRIVGDRPRLSVKRAVALSLVRGAIAVTRRRAVDAAASRYNPTKRALTRIQAEMAAEHAVQTATEVTR